jgi:hypothetical protein
MYQSKHRQLLWLLLFTYAGFPPTRTLAVDCDDRNRAANCGGSGFRLSVDQELYCSRYALFYQDVWVGSDDAVNSSMICKAKNLGRINNTVVAGTNVTPLGLFVHPDHADLRGVFFCLRRPSEE